jgi:hypothetical protein
MVTCPWCGTNYAAFQSNCDRCGGPLALPTEASAAPAAAGAGSLPTPPPAPRPVADSYAWRLVWSDGCGVVGFIFTLLGAIFAVVGLVLTLAIVTAFVGLPFVVLGLLFLIPGGMLLSARYQQALRTVGVLRTGEAATGQIARVEQNLAVRVNNQHPWKISYQFRVHDLPYEGQVTTLNTAGAALQPRQAARVLYLPQAPQYNSLYPHP